MVWGAALLGLTVCAGFDVRLGSGRLAAAPAQQATVGAAQTSGGGSAASQAPSRGTPDATNRTPGQPTGGRGFGPGWEWWKDDAVKKAIGLRAQQAADIDRFYTRRLKDMDPVLQAYEQERAALDKMMADRVVDDTQLDLELTTKYLPLYSKLFASRQMMLYRISKVLDPDQFAKLQAINEQHQQLMAGRRGRGGAPAPRPPGLLR
jgi:hypothetical protein